MTDPQIELLAVVFLLLSVAGVFMRPRRAEFSGVEQAVIASLFPRRMGVGIVLATFVIGIGGSVFEMPKWLAFFGMLAILSVAVHVQVRMIRAPELHRFRRAIYRRAVWMTATSVMFFMCIVWTWQSK
jgi:hypothetical protein